MYRLDSIKIFSTAIQKFYPLYDMCTRVYIYIYIYVCVYVYLYTHLYLYTRLKEFSIQAIESKFFLHRQFT